MKSVAYFRIFFYWPGQATSLFTTRYRSLEPTELWTSEAPEHYKNKPVYILTSKSTFSGAEAFAYTLKALKRATIIGEKTAGGANGELIQSIENNLIVMIPAAETISALTNSNWEHSGIAPDIVIAKETSHELSSDGLSQECNRKER
jgi:C-terminal processing protease CtpA/Prc